MVSYRRRRGQLAKLQPKFVGHYCVVEVLPNHTYCVERSAQVSVQSEQCLKLFHAHPDAVGQAPPLMEPNCQSNTQGRGTQPREVEIFVRGIPEPDPELEPPPVPDQLEQQALGPAPTPVEDAPTRSTGECRNPLPPRVEEPPTPQEPVYLGRSQRDRRAPRYLADYHVGHMELPFQRGSTPSTGNYPHLVAQDS